MDIITRIDNSSDGWRYYQGLNEETREKLWCYPSVTTKIDAVYPTDPYLLSWIRENGAAGKDKFEKAAEEGTEVHIAIDTLLNGGKVPSGEMSNKVKRCIQAFIDWYIEFKPKVLASEEMVVNHPMKYAGTRDLLCELNYVKGKVKYKGVYVIDYKTSSAVHDHHRIQVAAYWACTPKKYKTALLHLGNKTKSRYSFLEFNPRPYFQQFKHFNKTFDLLNPEAQPHIEEYPELFELISNPINTCQDNHSTQQAKLIFES